jgi:hypothetical protein
MLVSFLDPEDGGDMFLRNVGLHGVISQKIASVDYGVQART